MNRDLIVLLSYGMWLTIPAIAFCAAMFMQWLSKETQYYGDEWWAFPAFVAGTVVIVGTAIVAAVFAGAFPFGWSK